MFLNILNVLNYYLKFFLQFSSYITVYYCNIFFAFLNYL